MKHGMQEMALIELEAVYGGGVFEDFFSALGAALDKIVEGGMEVWNLLAQLFD